MVICTLGSYDTLERVLDGYDRQRIEPDRFEVLLVVDAAEPDPEAVTRAVGSRSFALRRLSGTVRGLSANRNVGWRAARAPVVLFTDNDTVPSPRLVAEHLRSHRSQPAPEAAVLGKVRWSPEVEVTTFMRWLDMGLQFNFANLSAGEVPWGAFVGANSSLKRSFIELVGPFDEERLPYGCEDTDFAYRASKLGLRLFYNPQALVDHLRTMSFEFYEHRIRRVAAAERQLSLIHPELGAWWQRIFSEVSSMPPVRGRGLAVARLVPRRTPYIGPRIWRSVDMAYKQALAPHFLEAWEAAKTRPAKTAQPDLSEWD